MNIKAITLTILVTLAGSAVPAYSQEVGANLPMNAAQYSLRRLAPGVASEQAVFPIDSSNRVRVEIIASVGGLNTSIVTPGSQTIDPSNVASLSGTFDTIEGAAEADSFLILPEATPGFRLAFQSHRRDRGHDPCKYGQ
jgi:hypothetical protein